MLCTSCSNDFGTKVYNDGIDVYKAVYFQYDFSRTTICDGQVKVQGGIRRLFVDKALVYTNFRALGFERKGGKESPGCLLRSSRNKWITACTTKSIMHSSKKMEVEMIEQMDAQRPWWRWGEMGHQRLNNYCFCDDFGKD